MRKLFLFLLSISFLFTLFTNKTLAVGLDVTPTNISYGEKVNITINNIDSNTAYRLIFQDSGGTQEFGDVIIGYNCNIDNRSPSFFSDLVCTNGTITGKLDPTSQVIDRTIDMTFRLTLGWPDGPINKSFTVNSSAPNPATFKIQSITPDPAKAGSTIQINLSDITKFGDYGYKVAEGDVNSKKCESPSTTCVLSLTLPSAYTTETTVTIIVVDPDNNRRTKTLTVQPITSVVTNTPLSRPCSDANYSDEEGCKRIVTAFGPVSTGANAFTRWVLGFVLSISGGLVILIIIISGYRLMTSQGDPEKVKNARDQLTAAIVGLLFIIFSLVILELITRDILGLPGFGSP